MEASLLFTVGLSHGIQWPWPIAVYLFLAGISGGAVAVALTAAVMKKDFAATPAVKAASVVGFIAIALGMLCLVADLTKPFDFWKILINYNLTSVMSLGVIALLFYIPLVFVLMVASFGDKCSVCAKAADIVKPFKTALYWVVLVLALAICAYTGFLISALIRYPLINTAVLPALFVASGLSAGAAAVKLLAVTMMGESEESDAMHALHKAEYPLMAAELFCLFMIFAAMVLGNAAQQAAAAAFTTGCWGQLFWWGVIGLGFVLPFVCSFVKGRAAMAAGATFAVVGMMCLRLFILYAGQTFVL